MTKIERIVNSFGETTFRVEVYTNLSKKSKERINKKYNVSWNEKRNSITIK